MGRTLCFRMFWISVILYGILLLTEAKVDPTARSQLPQTSSKPEDEKRARFLGGFGLGDTSFQFGVSKFNNGGFPFSGGFYGQGYGNHHHHHNHGFGLGGIGAYGGGGLGGFGYNGFNPYLNRGGYFGGSYGFKHQFQHGYQHSFGYPGGYYPGGLGAGGGYGFH